MKKCKNCTKYASYGKRGSKKMEYCKEHSPPGYVNVKHKTCIHENCEKQPVYGKRGTKKKEYCKEHSPPGYVDVKHKTCIHENKEGVRCETRPTYGKRGSKKKEYCKEHSPPGYVDVVNKTCIHESKEGVRCETRPTYSYPGYAPEYCKKHIPNKRMVIYPLKKPKEEDKECEFCLNPIHYNETFCSSCKKYIELGNRTVKAERKELEIKNLLDQYEIKYTHDSVVSDGCSKKRPDFLIPTEWGNIILEVDEHQHKRKNYSCECEVQRMKQIYHDVGCSHLLFIRYNPDSYKTVRGNPTSQNERFDFLIKMIREYIHTKPGSNLSVVYLFYDKFITDPNSEYVGCVEPDFIDPDTTL